MKEVYIAGPISGDPNYKKKFAAVEAKLKDIGFWPYNPAKSGETGEHTYRWFINEGLKALMVCDAICLLPGWKKSNGALLEFAYAATVNLPAMQATEKDGDWVIDGYDKRN